MSIDMAIVRETLQVHNLARVVGADIGLGFLFGYYCFECADIFLHELSCKEDSESKQEAPFTVPLVTI